MNGDRKSTRLNSSHGDESRASGEASSISFPTTEDEVRAILETLHAERVPVTVQGARTGLGSTGTAAKRSVGNLAVCRRAGKRP